MTSRVAAALVAAAALLLGAAPAAAKVRHFRTPSHNIVCLYASEPAPRLRCDVLSLNDTGFTLDRTRRGRRVHITDSVNDTRAPDLRYGTSRRFGPFTCTSRRTGLTCRSRPSGHGFFLSRARQRVS